MLVICALHCSQVHDFASLSSCLLRLLYDYVIWIFLRGGGGWGGGDVPGRHTYPPFCPATLCRTVVEPGRLGVVQTRCTLRIHKQKSRLDHFIPYFVNKKLYFPMGINTIDLIGMHKGITIFYNFIIACRGGVIHTKVHICMNYVKRMVVSYDLQ